MGVSVCVSVCVCVCMCVLHICVRMCENEKETKGNEKVVKVEPLRLQLWQADSFAHLSATILLLCDSISASANKHEPKSLLSDMLCRQYREIGSRI